MATGLRALLTEQPQGSDKRRRGGVLLLLKLRHHPAPPPRTCTVAFIFVTPSASESCVRYTAAWFCIVFCISSRMLAVERAPLA